jgi:thiosulfate reductase/polysulfide reductase chain A
MSKPRDFQISRRRFLKLAGGTAAAAVSGPALFNGAQARAQDKSLPPLENRLSVCDMCFNKCSLIARVRGGVVEKLDPNPKFLKSRGMLCARGNAGIRQLYDPNRLKHPLLRKGARGEGKWQRLTWDQALDHAAEKLEKLADKYTRCSTVFMAGSDMQSTFVHRFAEAYGSFNVVSHESMCLISGTRGFLDTFGEVPIPDLQYSKYVVMLGANRFEALVTPDSIDLMTAMQKGCKLVVLDPRYTKTAARAHEWHPIKPRTDMAFLLGVANVLVNEELYDKEFVARRCSGLEELREHVQKYTPEWAAKETEIPAEAIRGIAHGLAAAAPASMIYPGRRSSNYTDSSQVRRAFAIVNALLGNWDQPGGLTATRVVGLKGGVPYEAPWYDNNPDDRADAHGAKLMFEEEGSFKLMRDAIINQKPYPLKGFINYKTNPMQTAANRQKTIQMANALDFMMTIEIVMSDTAHMADLVLPSQCALERQDPCSAQQGSSACACVVWRDPVVDKPMFESKSAFWIMQQLANRLKLEEAFDFSMDDYRKAQLKELPGAAKALTEDGVYYNPSKLYGIYENKAFKTKTSKIELYNQRYKEAGLDPLPIYQAPKEVPRDKFRLVVGRNAVITQSSSTNNSLLQEFQPDNRLWIHPEKAAQLGIADGDMVTVKSQVSQQKLAARVTSQTRPDVVYMATGFGVLSDRLGNLKGKGACIAEILDDQMDELTGNMAMHETLVTVSKGGA